MNEKLAFQELLRGREFTDERARLAFSELFRGESARIHNL
jgi:hypothetical protein